MKHGGTIKKKFFYLLHSPLKPRRFNTLFIQDYSVICRPSDHTMGRPGLEPGTGDLVAGTLTARPPHGGTILNCVLRDSALAIKKCAGLAYLVRLSL